MTRHRDTMREPVLLEVPKQQFALRTIRENPLRQIEKVRADGPQYSFQAHSPESDLVVARGATKYSSSSTAAFLSISRRSTLFCTTSSRRRIRSFSRVLYIGRTVSSMRAVRSRSANAIASSRIRLLCSYSKPTSANLSSLLMVASSITGLLSPRARSLIFSTGCCCCCFACTVEEWYVLENAIGCRGIMTLLSKSLHTCRSTCMLDDNQLIGFEFFV